MYFLYFANIPANVAPTTLQDTITKYLKHISDQPQRFLVSFNTPDQTLAEHKHSKSGSLIFYEREVVLSLWVKLKTEPIIFKSEPVLFSREPPTVSSPRKVLGSSSQTEVEPMPRVAQSVPHVAKGHISAKPARKQMNLNKVKQGHAPPRPSAGPRPENPLHERKLRHRLSALGQRARLEKIEFGVLRNHTFSVEYSRGLLESGGDLSFEDDKKSLRVIMGGTHQDLIMPSIKVAIQTISYVALGDDFGTPYMFLGLLQNPHFERADASQSTTGNDKEDSRNSRTRHSALDALHRRVAPYASRWLKLSFYSYGVYPGRDTCLLAGLPLPDMNPNLTFSKLEMYSRRNVDTLEKWLQGGSLPWEVAFQCEALFRNGILVPQELLSLRPLIDQLAKKSLNRACDALISLRSEIEGDAAPKRLTDFNHQSIVLMFEKHVIKSEKNLPASQLRDMTSGLKFMCHHVKITPTAVFLTGPFSEQSNRIIRQYSGFESYFIRVSFTDEGDTRSYFDDEVDTDAFSEARVGRFLKYGLQIGDRNYELLAYSQSGFSEHTYFFSASFVFNGLVITPESIRTSLGNFSRVINCPARYGARMSQAFSSTYPSITITKSVILHLPEIQTMEEKLEFSDGCGTISSELAEEVWQAMNKNRGRETHENEPTPCVFQIRIGGYKGMVRLDSKLKGRRLGLRPSMDKYDAPPDDLSLEIAWAPEKPIRCILNRPLVMLMWTNGVESSVFENLMARALETTITDMQTFGGVAKLLITNQLGRSFLLASTFDKLSRLQLGLDQDGVRTAGLHKLINATLYHIKVGLKHKARIPVPGGHTLVGVCDEDNYLRPREIYACVQYFDHSTGTLYKKHLKGRMLVTRSPVIHPGDAQILWAIGTPPPESPFGEQAKYLPNCVVFSTRGRQPVPNMLGGGDLDGVNMIVLAALDYSLTFAEQDTYNLIPLPELIPPEKYMPAKYPRADLETITGESTINDVADFIVKYICSNTLGLIATNHLVVASGAELRAKDHNCMTYAKLYSKASVRDDAPRFGRASDDFFVQAVDFPKTGKPVPREQIRRPKYNTHINPVTKLGLQPDWQAGHGRDPSDGYHYECPSVLGRLFRAVQLPQGNPARERVNAPQIPEAIQKELARHVGKYAEQIRETHDNAAPWVGALLSRESSERVSEVEVILGTNLEPSKSDNLVERMKRLTGDLTTFVRLEIRGGKNDGTHNWLARAWRAYQLSSDLGDTTFGAFSFSWIALGSVLDALNELDKNFLPPTGPIVPPFLPATTKPEDATGDLDEFPPFDLDRWEWDDDVKSKRGIRNDTGGPASTPPQTPPPTRNYADSSRSSPGGGPSEYSGGNGQGRKKISPRGSYDGRQVNKSSTSGSTNTNGTGRGRGFKILS